MMGSGPFKFAGYETGQSIKGERNPDYYVKAMPYLDGFIAHLRRQTGDPGRGDPRRPRRDRVPRHAALGARRAQGRRSATRSRCRKSDWNCRQPDHPEPQEKAVRRCAGAPRADPGDRPLEAARRRCRRSPSSRPSAASPSPARRWRRNKDELEQIAGYLARHREVARRGETAAEGGRRRRAELRAAQPQRRPAVQIRRHLADRRVEQDRAQGDAKGRADRPLVRRVAQRRFRCRRSRRSGHGIVNPRSTCKR